MENENKPPIMRVEHITQYCVYIGPTQAGHTRRAAAEATMQPTDSVFTRRNLVIV